MLIFNRRYILVILSALLLLMLITPPIAESWIQRSEMKRSFTDHHLLKAAPVALVLGTTPKIGVWENLFFQPRIVAAAELFHKGKVRSIIVSGDNGSEKYDEPTEMKLRLVRLGVPEERVVCDYAGFRTLDSVVRAKEVFGQTQVIIVSQRFHNLRALYIATSQGIKAEGYDATDPPSHWTLKTRLREKLACVKALLDVHVLGTRPRFLGEPVVVPK